MDSEATITIRQESPLTDDARRLIAASQAAMEEVYSPDEIFSLTAEALATSDTRFFVARREGRPLGCVALVSMGDYGEVKRLFVDSAARGLGVGRALLGALEKAARDAGLSAVKLETGPELAAAVGLYRSAGYEPCDRFGDYENLACSLFLEKRLA